MRRVPVAFAFMLAVLFGTPRSFGQIESVDAGAPSSIASASAPDETAPRDSLPARLGKALVFGVVVSALLVAGKSWRRGRRTRTPKNPG